MQVQVLPVVAGIVQLVKTLVCGTRAVSSNLATRLRYRQVVRRQALNLAHAGSIPATLNPLRLTRLGRRPFTAETRVQPP